MSPVGANRETVSGVTREAEDAEQGPHRGGLFPNVLASRAGTDENGEKNALSWSNYV